MVNEIKLQGTLGSDACSNGKFISFPLSQNFMKDNKEEILWMQIKQFVEDKKEYPLLEKLVAGSEIIVEGYLQQDFRQAQDTGVVYKLIVIVANKISFVEK